MKYISLNRFKKEILKSPTSHRMTAFSMALGVWLAFSPFPGLHLVIAFVLQRIFKLNGVVLLVGILVHNPWTMIPIHLSGLAIGDLILSGSLDSLALFDEFPWNDLGISTVFSSDFWHDNWQFLRAFLKPFFCGSLVLASSFSVAAYNVTLRILKRAAMTT